MKKVIFGGTFDPIHNGHIHIAYEALYNLEIDEIIFMPAGQPPHKSNKRVTGGKIRYEMVLKAIEGEERFSVSDYEIKNKGLSYTYNTLIHFNKIEPDTEWFFLVGVDSLMALKTWMNIDIILDNCTLVVFSRSGFLEKNVLEMKARLEAEYNTNIIFLQMPLLDISSTTIKEKIAQHKVVNYLLPYKVERMINKYNLYRDKV
ncbi:nicotinate-nucleotide adenylyltransferase [Clostridium culturomicium]|uniref:nicotinate-nucleotide adenylyltransferase n=1 Tax=Clostridium culturomicium TaxID=1499683 RepID=UPI00058F4034|nr:nicotinate-nucleotide adenylyltransferase [Clostridium culturomicium]